MPRSGTLVICVQNLDFSGANQVVLNIVAGRMHESNVVVLSPKIGTFAARFVESGAAVRIGNLTDLLDGIRDVFCIICNTIMTANIVVEMSRRSHPCIWILHEWWDDEMIVENLRIRNYEGLTLQTVKQAFATAAMVVCVCESQRRLYNPTAPSSVIFVGVPDPLPRIQQTACDTPDDAITDHLGNTLPSDNNTRPFNILCLGIICPRKNQLWTVQLFKKFAANKTNVRLQIVGARYIRVYEMEYLDKVKAEIGDDPRIEVLDVTDDVEKFYRSADCLMLTSLNEVTPMVISEALSWSLPVLSTNIAGIKEMYTDGVEGFLFSPGEEAKALAGMEAVYGDPALRQRMGKAARARFETAFDLDLMVESYRHLVLKVSPPRILVDMDGALVDWDKGFCLKWADRCPINRGQSYHMELCVDPKYRKEAESIFLAKGFFENLEPMEGALQALHEMEKDGLKVYICTAPLKQSKYCAQEKLNWVAEHLGSQWVDRVILCQDKTAVSGDLLIDDKPYDFLHPGGRHTTATWKQIVFDAPYNRQQRLVRMFRWSDWRAYVYPMLGRAPPSHLFTLSRDEARLPLSQKALRSLNIAVPAVKRDASVSSIHSGMSAEDVQKTMDMLQASDTPLQLEEIASIVSGSLSLVDDSEDDEIADMRHRQRMSNDLPPSDNLSGAKNEVLAEKKKMLHEKLQQRNELYRKSKESTEKKLALETDPADFEGLQLFRNSYNIWKMIGSKKGASASQSPHPHTDKV